MGNGHVKEVASLMEGEWFCYKGGLFNGGGMVMEVGSLMGEEWSCLRRWPVLKEEEGLI